MNSRPVLLACICLLLTACIKKPVFKGDEYAYIRSSYPIVTINGEEIERSYMENLLMGENSLVVVYNTYQYDYFCTFSWTVKANTVYEVVAQDNRYPLTMYRWVRTNAFWSSRLDPLDPLVCDRKARH